MGQIMIIIGVICAALAAWLIPHGYYILEREKKTKIRNYTKIETRITGDNSIVIGQAEGDVIINKEIKNDEITPEDKLRLSPKVDIKLFSYPEKAATPYKYPLKRYILMVQNLNKDSVPIFDFRIEFIFKNIIREIKLNPLLHSGGSFSVSGLNIYKENKNGSVFKYEEQPIDTPITENFSLIVQQAKINEKIVNTNIAIFTCERWPESTGFSGDIILDLSEMPEILKKPERIGAYEGVYFYEIKGHKFSENINGTIPNVK